MTASRRIARTLVAMLLLGACGAPGLPPAGPGPGEVEVGYGTRQETETTGAVASIAEGEMGKSRPFSVAELLAGRVAGLAVMRGPDGSAIYRIRGVNSLLADQEPLFILDNVPLPAGTVNNALAGLTSEDIRQVDVLKDVASTAIYGTRGAGGVVIITTRR